MSTDQCDPFYRVLLIGKKLAHLTGVGVGRRTLLLIDDIYDSGYMLREVGQTLMKAGTRAVYPFTITRTMHSDDQ